MSSTEPGTSVPADLFERVFRSAFDAIVVTRLEDAVVVAANPAFIEMTGASEVEIVGRPAIDMWVDPAERDAMVKQLLATGRVEGLTARFRQRSGRILIGEFTSQLIDLHGAKGILTNARDVTEVVAHRHIIEHRVGRASQVATLARSLTEWMSEGPKHIAALAAEALAEVLECPVWLYRTHGPEEATELLARSPGAASIPPAEDTRLLSVPLRSVGRTTGLLVALFGEEDQGDAPNTVADEDHRTEDGLFLQEVADLIGQTLESASLLATLRGSEAERRRLLAGIVSAQDDERRHLAADLHDDPIQRLTAVDLRLAAIRRQVDDTEVAASLAEVEASIEETAGRLRSITFDLRPQSLDSAGLTATIREFTARSMDRSAFELRINDLLDSEPAAPIATALYRIAREALINADRHAGATTVTLEIGQRRDGIQLLITDNGVGFAMVDGNGSGHLGISTMRERAEVAGGWCQVTSKTGEGTTVECWIPTATELREQHDGRETDA